MEGHRPTQPNTAEQCGNGVTWDTSSPVRITDTDTDNAKRVVTKIDLRGNADRRRRRARG